MRRGFAFTVAALTTLGGWVSSVSAAEAVSYRQPRMSAAPVVQASAYAADPTPTVSAPQLAPAAPDYSSGNTCCEPLLQSCDACGEKACCGGFVAGAGFYYIKPEWEVNPAFEIRLLNFVQFETDTPGTFGIRAEVTRDTSCEFKYDYDFAPLVWVGYALDCGVGVRARWWQFDQSAFSRFRTDNGGNITPPGGAAGAPEITFASDFVSIDTALPLGLGFRSSGGLLAPATTTFPGGAPPLVFLSDPETVVFDTHLDLDVWDLEAACELFRDCNCCGFSLMISGGVRIARIDQGYKAFLRSDSGDRFLALLSGHDFKGAGPTVALEARIPICCCCMAIYGSARGSTLFGTAQQEASLVGQDVAGTPAAPVLVPVSLEAESDEGDALPNFEFELGTEWSKCCGRNEFFVQSALVFNLWHGAGNGAKSEQFFAGKPPGTTKTADDENADLYFFGLTVSAGVRF